MEQAVKVSILVVLAITIMTASSREPKAASSEKIINQPPIEYMEVPPFVNVSANYIHYHENISDFFTKLRKLKNGELKRLHILHIGDSHLQAGYLTGELRYLFQTIFGHAGRGLVFPYQIAKTNAPFDIKSQSNVEWECARNINLNHDFPVGVCGYSLRTNNVNFNVSIQLKNPEDHFDKVTIFGPTGADAFDLELWGTEDQTLLPTRRQPFKSGTCFTLEELRTGLSVSGKKTEDGQSQYTLQGLLLENTRNKGILYSSVGVNGATFYAYNRSEQFMEQLSALDPDLIIVSLGTNEAADANMTAGGVQKQLLTFLDNLKKNSECKSVLLVTPPDIYLRSRYKTKHGMELADMMHDVAKTQGGIAIWDFYEVMGGYGAINNWLYANLAAKDRIHYTADGYRLQAQLLFKAFMQRFGEE